MTTVESSLHEWMNKHFPRIGVCEECASTDRKTEYASIDHSYTRDRKDWRELCRSCHLAMDGHPMQGKARPAETRAKISGSLTGKTPTEETRVKLRSGMRQRWAFKTPEERSAQAKRAWATRRAKEGVAA